MSDRINKNGQVDWPARSTRTAQIQQVTVVAVGWFKLAIVEDNQNVVAGSGAKSAIESIVWPAKDKHRDNYTNCRQYMSAFDLIMAVGRSTRCGP